MRTTSTCTSTLLLDLASLLLFPPLDGAGGPLSSSPWSPVPGSDVPPEEVDVDVDVGVAVAAAAATGPFDPLAPLDELTLAA